MANLYLTHKCNRGCPFCFARKVLRESGGRVDELLTVDEVRRLLDRFQRELPAVGLLGGEPFLYPHLDELLALLKERKVGAKIFTSATNPLPAVLERMTPEQAKADRINFVVNLGTRDTYTDEKFANLDRFFRRFAPVSCLSYTIFDLNASASHLFDLIDEYGLQRAIRTGIALPILHGGNSYIALDDYKRASDYLVRVASEAASRQIVMSMDCGFIACMFTDEQLGHLQRCGGELNFSCGAAVDIGPGLQAWNCFPLFQVGRVDAMKASSLRELMDMLSAAVKAELGDACGVKPECHTCDLMRRHLCEGGCASFKSCQENISYPSQINS